MRKSSWIGIGFFVAGIAFLSFVYFPGSGSDSDIKELYDFSSNGLTLNVVTNGEEFLEGDVISIETTLQNELSAPVTYDERCGEPITITVNAEMIGNELIQKNPAAACGEDESKTASMISNEQLSKSAQFDLEIPLNEQETTLAPSDQYTINITFYPTAQPAFTAEIPIVIKQQNTQLVNVNEAKKLAMQSYKAKIWFEIYRDTERYLISEELPYLKDNEWVFTWHAMNIDQANSSSDTELIVKEGARVE
ncbi:hypothetical protein [Jeotgalibacillus marinus]|uniref:DUF5643 domain-containing protein n=1 Tax=Jeotgalibacillus marinus TaxID=86667 RepID=A0ABV3Q4P9_9BACL